MSDINPELIKAVNDILASEYVLYTNTQNYHWNVISSNFYEIHTFLEKQYQELSVIIDEVAEKVRALQGVALGSLTDFLKHSEVKEASSDLLKDKEIFKNLLENHTTLIKQLKERIELAEEMESPSTEDFLTALLEKHEHMAWMLRSFDLGN